ncbi:hypothetical protein BDZ89DRAFT_1056694 [Hymenopellis radicata]|nr:hypothetical protein BDZ89DRAFT_1056694 [Hymenopellis radicata]
MTAVDCASIIHLPPPSRRLLYGGAKNTSNQPRFCRTHIDHRNFPMPAPPRIPHRGPVFIYYKLYDDDKKEMLSIRSPIGYANDPCVGRVDTSRIPIPIQSMRLSHPEAYNLEYTVDLLGAERPGSTPQEPVLLKVWYEEPKLRTQTCRQLWVAWVGEPAARSVTSHRSAMFIYYKLYDDDERKMIQSCHPVGTDPSSDGSTHARSHSAHYPCASSTYMQAGGPRFGLDHDSAYGTMLLRTVDSPAAYNLEDTVDLLNAERPGSTPQEPVLLKVWYEDLQAILGEPDVTSHRIPVSSV